MRSAVGLLSVGDEQRRAARCWRVAAALLIAAVLASCTTAPPTPGEPPPYAALVERADIARGEGRLVESAALLERAAEVARRPAANRLRLEAALVYLDLGREQEARRLLDATAVSRPPQTVALLRRLVEARLLTPQDPNGAVVKLTPVPGNLNRRLTERWLDALATARLEADDALDAARALDRRSELLYRPDLQHQNRARLWQALAAMPLAELRQRVPATPDRFGGWLELAHAIRTHRLALDATRTAVDDWRARYPNHVAVDFADELVRRQAALLEPPKSLALMLPLSGRLAEVGEAVRDGFLTAYYAAPAPRPRLRVYDVGESGTDSLSTYRDAVESGVELVVGPLTKPAVERLTIWDDYPVPVLALNTVIERSEKMTPGLYQFGLAPEDDARAVADLMRTAGHKRVVTLIPASEWGERVGDAFRTAFQETGGTVLESGRYDAESQDFSEPIREIFNLDVSERRYQQLRSLLRRRIEFEPRRRQDMDAVFFAAFPLQARLIRPQIRFYHGIGVPVFATSHAYSGTPDPTGDQDMNGLALVELPWLLGLQDEELLTLHNRVVDTWPESQTRLPRLVALGVDAYRLTRIVDVMSLEPDLVVPGATGRLRVDESDIVHRAPPPARIHSGRLEPIQDDGSRTSEETAQQ